MTPATPQKIVLAACEYLEAVAVERERRALMDGLAKGDADFASAVQSYHSAALARIYAFSVLRRSMRKTPGLYEVAGHYVGWAFHQDDRFLRFHITTSVPEGAEVLGFDSPGAGSEPSLRSGTSNGPANHHAKDTNMPKVSDMQPSKYLKASDADEEDLVLTMSHVKEESLGQGAQAENKWVLYFENHDKGLVLNKVNMNTIAKLYGDDTDDWEGKKITLFSTEVTFQGNQVPALRVRSKAPKAKAKETAKAAAKSDSADPADDEDIPF